MFRTIQCRISACLNTGWLDLYVVVLKLAISAIHHAGDISISGDLTFDSDELTLTCISTGGPATTVTWTRDSITVTQGTETVLNGPETANYTHTLTIATAGNYTCIVSNNKPSSASATITVTGITVSYVAIC